MKLSCLLSAVIIGSSSSFAPVPFTQTHTRSLHASSVEEIEAPPAAPVFNQERSPAIPFLPYPQNLKGYPGDVGFDPWGFSENWEMDYLREAEIKHGRVCMMAWLGWVSVDGGLRVYPTPEGWTDLTSLTAWSTLQESPTGWLYSPLGLFTVFIGIIEALQFADVNTMLRGDQESARIPGDLDFDVLSLLKDKTDAEVMEMKTKEILHCRLGMLAFVGVLAQTYMGSTSFPYLPIFS